MPPTARARRTLVLALVLGGLTAVAPLRAAVDRTVLVTVVDDKGQPVDALTTSDIEVREDGAAREVLRVERATDPLMIALLIDDSAAAERPIKDFRDGSKAFVNTIAAAGLRRAEAASAAQAGRNQIALITFGERSTLVRDYTSDAAALASSIDRIFARTGSGMQLLDALVDSAKGLAKREESARKHIVVLMTEGIEFSTLHDQTVVDAIHRAGATMHAIVLTTVSASNMSQEVRTRNIVLDVGPRTTGGRRDNLLAESAVPGALASLAKELLAEYRVVYSRPDTLIPPEKLSVRATKPGMTARARTRVPR